MKAYLLIRTYKKDDYVHAFEKIAKIAGVLKSDRVFGSWDVIAKIEGKTKKDIARIRDDIVKTGQIKEIMTAVFYPKQEYFHEKDQNSDDIMMSYLLINTRSIGDKCLEYLSELNTVKEAHKVFGPSDIVAELETGDEAQLSRVIAKIRRVYDVVDTLTLIVEN